MIEFKWLVDFLYASGVNLPWIALAVMVTWALWRSAKREETLAARQERFHSDILAEVDRLRKLVQECEKERDDMRAVNMALDRWKAVCEDKCENAATIHAWWARR